MKVRSGQESPRWLPAPAPTLQSRWDEVFSAGCWWRGDAAHPGPRQAEWWEMWLGLEGVAPEPLSCEVLARVH